MEKFRNSKRYQPNYSNSIETVSSGMHWCESKKALLNEVEAQDCYQNPNHYSKICGQMYKRLQREHLLLQRSFLTVYQTLNESLSKSQGIEEYVSNISESIKSDDFDSLTNITLTNPKLEKKSEVHPTEPLESSIPVIVYKKLSKEHLTLQRSFTSVCHSLREALDKSQRPKQQKKYNKDSDELKREIELLKLELQESRDQNELFEFRIHELEQIKEIACIKCCKLESQLLDTNNENQKLSERFNASKRVLNDLIVKYGLKEDINLLLHKSYNKIDAIDRNRYLCSAMTSEDEGLGDDSRRDHSSGPSSLADMQECECDVMSEKSTQMNDNDSNATLRRSVCLQTDSFLSECQNLISEVNKNRDLIGKLEKSLKQMKEEKASLEEQVLELEEAENDARLVSQRLQQQLNTFVDQYETIQLDLINANKTIDLNNNRIESFEKIESELKTQLEDIKSILLKQTLVENNCYRNEHNFLDESNKRYSIGRFNILDKEDKTSDQCKPPIDGLYSFLWEKLYRIETQIDCLQQSYGKSVETLASHETDDDLQLFICAENLPQEVSNIGSSFEVSQFHSKYGQSYGQSETKGDPSLQSTPLCETVKPEKIDISLDNYWHSKASISSTLCLSPEVTDKVYKLQSNEQNLRQRLVQLEWINKEFIRELELRERVFFQRENHQKEWLISENELKNSIDDYQSQLNHLRTKSKAIRDQINRLNEKIISITEENGLKRTENNLKSNHENNCVISLEKLLKELEFKFNDYLSRIESFEEIDPQNNLNKTDEKQDSNEFKQMFVELKKHFPEKMIYSIDCHNCPKTQVKQQIDCIETEKTILNQKLIEISEKEIILETYLNQKENECRKARQTYEAKIESLNEEHKRVENGLRLRMKEMENQTSTTVNELEMERNQIIRELEQYLNQIQSNEIEYRKEINKLTENVNKIEAKISELVEFGNSFDKLNVEKLKLKVEVNSVQSNEEQLKKKLNEMMEKEAAYKETLSNADKIIGSVEHNYKQRINELEASETKLKIRITQLEDTESRLRSNLRTERRTSDSYGKASDLVQQLIDSEARESTLKQQIKGLELRINELEQNLEEVNQTKKRIESELKDQDELVSNVHQLKQQIESLKKDLNKSLQSQDSIQNMLKETEKYYQRRDEEMQTKYKSLEDEKCDLELTIQHLKHSLRHSQNTHSFASFSNNNNNSMELKIIQDINDSNESNSPKNFENIEEKFETISKTIKSEDLDQTFLNVEKCLKRAMAVITLEIKQKDIEDKSDNCVVAVTPDSSSQKVKNFQNFKVSVQAKNGCSSKTPKTLPSKWTPINKPLAPKNFTILKKVSSDSLLIGWQTNKEDNISGYQILVNEVLVKRVQNPNATKSLVRKLDLNKSLEIKIKSISCCGQLSEGVITEYLPMCWIQPLLKTESTDYSSDSSDSSESSANQITRL